MNLSFTDRLSEQVESGTFRAVGDNVLVRIDQDQGDLRPDSLIVAPGNVKRDRARGMLATVVAVGPGHYPEVKLHPSRPLRHGTEDTSPVRHKRFIPTEVQVGQRVVLASHLSGDVLHLRNGEHRVVREAEILAVVESEVVAPWLVDELRALADKPVEPAGWRKQHGQWWYGPGPMYKAAVGPCPTGWNADVEGSASHWEATEQDALDWASAKLGVEAPRVEAPRVEKPCSTGTCQTCKGTGREEDDYGPGTHTCPQCAGNGNGQAQRESPSARETRQREESLRAVAYREGLRDGCNAARGAAGPWKAWPENKPPKNGRYLVRVSREPGGFRECIFYRDGEWCWQNWCDVLDWAELP